MELNLWNINVKYKINQTFTQQWHSFYFKEYTICYFSNTCNPFFDTRLKQVSNKLAEMIFRPWNSTYVHAVNDYYNSEIVLVLLGLKWLVVVMCDKFSWKFSKRQ